MYQIGFVLLCCVLLACKDKEPPKVKEEQGGFQFSNFADKFKAASVPYLLSDTGLLKNKDTSSISSGVVASYVPDSIKKNFGKGTMKYMPLVKFQQKGKESYFLLKASTTGKTGALLLVFDKENNYSAMLPFLIPDADASTSQATTIDKSFTVSKNIVQRTAAGITAEGKEVWAYDAVEKKFSLIMTDLLNENPAVLINPIDTFRGANKFAGDYYLNKKNLLAIRDGRHPNQLLIYIHTENSEGDCKGELKGEALITSPATAAYRQGGDPCVLGLSFAGNTVTIKEESGCGNHRNLDCPLAGTFTRKKDKKVNEPAKKKKGNKAIVWWLHTNYKFPYFAHP